eukprot:s5436_g1.t1
MLREISPRADHRQRVLHFDVQLEPQAESPYKAQRLTAVDDDVLPVLRRPPLPEVPSPSSLRRQLERPRVPPGDCILLEAVCSTRPSHASDLAPVLLTMKTLLTEEVLKVPKGITIKIKSKVVEVKGKHGELKRDFKHLPIELFLSDGGKKVVARMYFAKSKQCSMLNSVCSHISNLFEGVAHKFEYKMRLVYAHFPINANIINGGKTIEIRNFLGEKVVRTVHMLPGVTVEKSASTKDELVVCGTDIELTGQSAALIHQSCLCKKKDIRKFLDGIYVSSHGVKED